MKIVAARPVKIDERTDQREYWNEPPMAADELGDIQMLLDAGYAEAEPGLLGWAPYTHTLRVTKFPWDGWTFHAQIEV